MTTSRPLPTHRVNRVVVGILRSRLHRVLSGVLVEIRYRGRRSGRWYSLPAQYAMDEGRPDRVVIYPGHPDSKVWWRSFLADAEACLVLRGVERGATGVVVNAGGADRSWAVSTYVQRFRKMLIPENAPLVVFTLDA